MDVQQDPIQSAQAAPTPSPVQPPKSNKKMLLIGGVIAVLLLAAGLFLLNKKPASAPATNVQQQAKKIPVEKAVSSKWYTIKTQYYTVSVPQGWKPKAESMQGGASLMLSQPNTEEDPLLVVESFTAPVSVQQKINLFRAMGLKEQKTNVPNSQPVMLAGTWPTRTLSGKTFKMPTQERVVYIPHGNSLFSVKLYYSSPKPEKVYDDMLEKVLSSFVSSS